MITIKPIVLEANGIRLEPMADAHHEALSSAAADGELWNLWFTAVAAPGGMQAYVATALQGQRDGHMLPWVVRDLLTGSIIGSTRYHDVVPGIDRVEIGHTWYSERHQRTHVNTTCKRMLLEHAFETIGCKVVGLRTDRFNLRSQRAIEALGAQKDGIIRHFGVRKDGSARDTVMYSILAAEWPDVRQHLDTRLARHSAPKVEVAKGEGLGTRDQGPRTKDCVSS
jgi:RimJ/RimL family protein N-acetyltransferase